MKMLYLYGAISSPASSSRVVLLHTSQNCGFPVFQTARRGCRVLSMNQGPAGNVAEEDGTSRKAGDDAIAQYVVIRKDLVDSLKWPLGSVLAQACHAAVAAVWIFKDHPDTIQYCDKLDSMTTSKKERAKLRMDQVTLEVKGETQLVNLAEKLRENNISHKLWIEQPENFPTCLATKPYPKSEVAQHFKKLKLCK